MLYPDEEPYVEDMYEENIEPFYIADLTDEQYELNRQEAYRRYRSGDDSYCFSTGICERTTAGYGRLDSYGYWEFPLTVHQETIEIVDDD